MCLVGGSVYGGHARLCPVGGRMFLVGGMLCLVVRGLYHAEGRVSTLVERMRWKVRLGIGMSCRWNLAMVHSW